MTTLYTYDTLDTHHREDRRAATLARLAAVPTMGIEVTVSELADACSLGNIDPQHGHDRGALLAPGAFPAGYVREGCMAAIDVACGCPLPPRGSALVTVRPDLDSIGGMAIVLLRALGIVDFSAPSPIASAVWARVCDISSADSYRPGAWAPRPLPTPGVLWSTDESREAVDGRRSLAYLGAICSPRPGQLSIALEERVAVMAIWLAGADDLSRVQRAAIWAACGCATAPNVLGERDPYETVQARMREAHAAVETSRRALAEELAPGYPSAYEVVSDGCPTCDGTGLQPAMDGGKRECEVCAGHQGAYRVLFVIMRVSHAGALGAGYCLAPVVVAFDQAVPGKVTIAAAEDGRADFAALRTVLNAAEGAVGGSPTWGGPRNLLGSPQGVGTHLSEDRIVELVMAACRLPRGEVSS